MTILEALDDPQLFDSAFAGQTWAVWRTVLAALFALRPTEADVTRFRALTGRKAWPLEPFREAWIVAGRRGGKSRISALVAVFVCCFRDWAHVLAAGERGVFMILAADRRQARVAFRYVEAIVDGCSLLGAMVERRTREAIYFTNRTAIEVHTASFRTVRGYSVLGAVLDEAAFWHVEDAANPDAEIIAALRPGMATTPGALLLGISSPYARRGELWRAFKEHFGRDDSDVLVVQAGTRELNATVPQSVIDRALERDPAAASAEYLAQFRSDVESFVSREAVGACVVPGRFELPLITGARYVAAVDPSGGSQDSFTLAIAHAEGDRVILDCVREVRPPFSPEAVVGEFAEVLRSYDLREVTGDRYAGQFPRELFRNRSIEYLPATRTKSDAYRELLPAINSGRVELLDNPRLIAQLAGLERRTARGGRDSIDHSPSAHDDLVNAAALALVAAGEANRSVAGVRRVIGLW
jgi:hypothetical protein